MNFYISKDSRDSGPFTIEQIRELIQQGELRTTDLLWTEGWPSWLAVSNVPGLITFTTTPVAESPERLVGILPPVPTLLPLHKMPRLSLGRFGFLGLYLILSTLANLNPGDGGKGLLIFGGGILAALRFRNIGISPWFSLGMIVQTFAAPIIVGYCGSVPDAYYYKKRMDRTGYAILSVYILLMATYIVSNYLLPQ